MLSSTTQYATCSDTPVPTKVSASRCKAPVWVCHPASIYVTELFNEYDVQVAIRIGTAGGIQDKTKVGDLVIAMTASTDSNINRRFTNGLDFAPHADFHLLKAAYEASQKFERVHVGGVSSMDFLL